MGKPDGIAGAATRRTVMAFQRDHALSQDGLITAGLIEKLKTLQAAQKRSAAINLSAGDTLIYSDSSVERVAADRMVQWDQAFGKKHAGGGAARHRGVAAARRALVWIGRSPMRSTKAAAPRPNGRAPVWSSISKSGPSR